MLILLAIVAFGRFYGAFIFGTSRKIEEDVRNEMFEHATKLSNSFYSKEKVGRLNDISLTI